MTTQQSAEADVNYPRGSPKRTCIAEAHQARSLAVTLAREETNDKESGYRQKDRELY